MRKIIVHKHSKTNHGNASNTLKPDVVYVDSVTGVSYQSNGKGALVRYFDVSAGSNITITNTPDNDPNPSLSTINASVGSAFVGFTEVNINANNSSLTDANKPIYVISAADDCKIVINDRGYVQFPPTSTLTKPIVMIYVDMGYTDLMPCNNGYMSSPKYAKFLGPELLNVTLVKEEYLGPLTKNLALGYRPIGHYFVANHSSTGFKFRISADANNTNTNTFTENIEEGDVLVSTGESYVRIPHSYAYSIRDDISNGDDHSIDNWQTLTRSLNASAHIGSGVYLVTANTKLANYNILYLGDGVLN